MKTTTQSSQYFIYLISSVAAVGGVLFGFDTGIISGALIFIKQTFHPSTVLLEFIVSSVVLGALIGAIASGHLADLFGRKRMLLMTAVTFILGTLLTVLAPSVNLLISGRFILGLAIGVSSYTVPLFISEMAPAALRGRLVLLNAIAITGGQAISFLIDYLLVNTQSWRLMFATGLVPAVLLFIGMLLVPETPRWLILKGAYYKAKKVLIKIRNTTDIEREYNQTKEKLNLKAGNWSTLFSKNILPVLFIGLGLGILQQFVGINTVMYYGPTIFKAAGFQDAASEILATFGMGVVNAIMSAVALLLVDKLGRRYLLITGLMIAGASLAIVGSIFYFNLHNIWTRWGALLCLIIYISGYCISIGSLFWLIIAEIYPLRVRGLAMSFVTAVQWGANFLVASTFLSIINTFGPANTFWLYGSMCILGILFTYFYVPETRGISLERIELNLQAKLPTRALGQPRQQNILSKSTVS